MSINMCLVAVQRQQGGEAEMTEIYVIKANRLRLSLDRLQFCDGPTLFAVLAPAGLEVSENAETFTTSTNT